MTTNSTDPITTTAHDKLIVFRMFTNSVVQDIQRDLSCPGYKQPTLRTASSALYRNPQRRRHDPPGCGPYADRLVKPLAILMLMTE
ncbi:hypothetical protein Pmani_019338 [Petrolisthes manimaculis]|uniref:Uncharacterized protein n=1 Tax=Petrolisthes manimaculis TaxID=1843537 RepID=A0AAE1PKM8_9EUCA|nr:hypothetical protein Pmani_019338 [Petrolisthes manimaculis]